MNVLGILKKSQCAHYAQVQCSYRIHCVFQSLTSWLNDCLCFRWPGCPSKRTWPNVSQPQSLSFCPLFRMGVLMWWLMMQETEWLLLLLPTETTSRYVEGPHDCQAYSNRRTRQAEIHHFTFALFWYFSIYPDCRYCSKARTDLELCQHGDESETAAGQKVTYAAHNTASAVGLHLFLR